MKFSKQRGKGKRTRGSANPISTLTTSSSSSRYTPAAWTSRLSPVAVFGTRLNTRLTYGVNIAPGTVGSVPTASGHRFRLSSLYDPDATGTGQQPYNYDTLTAIYRSYIVTACYVDVTFNNPTRPGLWVGWSIHGINDTNSAPNGMTLGDLMSRPNVVCTQISSTGTQSVTCRVKVEPWVLFGITRTQYMSLFDVYGAAYNSNPNQPVELDFFICDPDSNVSPQYVRVAGRLVFDVQFFDRFSPGSS